MGTHPIFESDFDCLTDLMVFNLSFRKKKKSKALHKSPIQSLVLQTQGLARASTSLTSLNEIDQEHREHYTRGGSLPPPTLAPHPSSGGACSTMGDASEGDFHLSDYERGVDLATPSSVNVARPIQRQRSLNESNEIVETLRHENAGLKETINRMEVSAKSTITVEKKSKKSNKRDNVEEIQGLNAALEKSLDETRNLHEQFTMSQETRHKLSLEREEHLRQIEELNLERNSFIESGRKTRQETDLMRQEWDENRLTHERLSRELFETRYSTSTRINEQEETILSLERKTRNLESDAKRLKNELDQARQQRSDSIGIADHDQIINAIRADFAKRLKLTEKGDEELKQLIRARDDEINRLHGEIDSQIRQKSELESHSEEQRQSHAEQMARVNPVFIENDGLVNQNHILLKQIQSLARQLDDAQRHVTILESQAAQRHHHHHRVPSSSKFDNSSVEMRQVLNGIKSDWREVVGLLAEVEEEKRTSRAASSLSHSRKERVLATREEAIYAKEVALRQNDRVQLMMTKK